MYPLKDAKKHIIQICELCKKLFPNEISCEIWRDKMGCWVQLSFERIINEMSVKLNETEELK